MNPLIHRLKSALRPAFVLAVLLPAFLSGQDGPVGRFSISASAGFHGAVTLGKLLPLSGTADVPDIEVLLESFGPEWGLSAGYALNRSLELQLSAAAARSRIVDDVGIGFAGVPLGRFEVSGATLWNIGVRLLWKCGDKRIAPYLAAGLGASYIDTREIGGKMSPALELASGAVIRLSRRLRAEIEVRDTISFFRYFEDFKVAYLMIYSADVRGVQHRAGARVGLRYLF